MSAKRLPMRKIREALRLSWGLGLTARKVSGEPGPGPLDSRRVRPAGRGGRAQLAAAC
jgi:hypothetical protein